MQPVCRPSSPASLAAGADLGSEVGAETGIKTGIGTGIGPLPAGERARVLRWLDDGLRGGRQGRLEAEYAVALAAAEPADHCVAWCDGAPVAHTFARRTVLRVRGESLPVGLIGSVYTDPAHRGRGLAGACIRAAATRLASQGAVLALLWSELDDFYTKLGFTRAGLERFYTLERSLVQRAQGAGAQLRVAKPGADDWPQLEALYARKEAGCNRAPGALAIHAAAPDCDVRVALCGERVVAYTACGRGDDFADVVHEWAGEGEGVLACLLPYFQTRTQLGLLAGPVPEAPTEALEAAGATASPGDLGFVRILDAPRLWRFAAGGDTALADTRLEARGDTLSLCTRAGSTALSHDDLLAWVIGSAHRQPPALVATATEEEALAQSLPLPLFLWGFDSV